jgi:hypothetical protein
MFRLLILSNWRLAIATFYTAQLSIGSYLFHLDKTGTITCEGCVEKFGYAGSLGGVF